jgi:hypothetical protein
MSDMLMYYIIKFKGLGHVKNLSLDLYYICVFL